MMGLRTLFFFLWDPGLYGPMHAAAVHTQGAHNQTHSFQREHKTLTLFGIINIFLVCAQSQTTATALTVDRKPELN